MSFLCAVWSDPWDEMTELSRLFDQFGNITFRPCYSLPLDPRFQQMQLSRKTSESKVVNSDKEFQVCFPMQHFKPEEINIKTKDNRVIIHARHEERPDEHGFIMREFTRQYFLPKDVDPNTVRSFLSSEGLLTLNAPRKALEAPKEISIPIIMDAGDAK